MKEPEKWQALARLLQRQRVIVLGQRNRAKFVRDNGLPNDRTIADLEAAKRDNYSLTTLLSLEVWYKLDAQQLRDILGPDIYPMHDRVVLTERAVVQVAGVPPHQSYEELRQQVQALEAILDERREMMYEAKLLESQGKA